MVRTENVTDNGVAVEKSIGRRTKPAANMGLWQVGLTEVIEHKNKIEQRAGLNLGAKKPHLPQALFVSTNSMTTTITDIITDELLKPTFEMTRQYLKILEVKYEDNKPKIAKIDFQENQSQATAYVEVKNESFYLVFVFDTTDKIEITGIDSFPFVGISFMPTSEELTTEELLKITSIKPTRTITKGDFFSNGKFEYTYNGLEFETFIEPERLEIKLKYLLDILETDLEGIKQLAKQTSTKDIFVTIVYHIGNGNFTGLYLDNETINRLSKVGLELTFDIYATGNKFENE